MLKTLLLAREVLQVSEDSFVAIPAYKILNEIMAEIPAGLPENENKQQKCMNNTKLRVVHAFFVQELFCVQGAVRLYRADTQMNACGTNGGLRSALNEDSQHWNLASDAFARHGPMEPAISG